MDANNHKTATADNSTEKKRFDPFNNRLARDIRNVLSEAFVEALAHLNRETYLAAAGRWNLENLPAEYRAYILDRLQRYGLVFKQIQDNRLDDPLNRALVIWNHGLFFEFHDHLEGLWQDSSGDEKQALKGLIKAAGVYVHSEFSHQQAVERLAGKSAGLLNQYSHCLAFIANLDELIKKLLNRDPVPPQLKNSEIGSA